MRRSGYGSLSAELGTNHCCSGGYVEALDGGAVLCLVWDAQAQADAGCCGGADAVSFVSQHDECVGRELLPINIVAVEESAEDGQVLRRAVDEFGKGCSEHFHVSHSAHAGLHGFWVIEVGAVGRAKDMVDAEPVGNADDGAKISRVLDVVECEA